MRASGGVYLTPAPRLSSTVRSVAITLASVNTQTMALCCVSWIFFLARCQGYCTAHMHAQLRRRCYLTSSYMLLQARYQSRYAAGVQTNPNTMGRGWTVKSGRIWLKWISNVLIYYKNVVFMIWGSFVDLMRHIQSIGLSFLFLFCILSRPTLYFGGKVLEVCQVDTVSSGLSQGRRRTIFCQFPEKHGTVGYIIQKGLTAHWNETGTSHKRST